MLIKCGSYSFDDTQLNYSHPEKECYAVVHGCEDNHVYVYGRAFKVITDALGVQKILEETKPYKKLSVRFSRMKARLSLYNATFEHQPGATNIADFLSRHAPKRPDLRNLNIEMEKHVNQIAIQQVPSVISVEQMLEAISKDDELTRVKKLIISKFKVKKELFAINNFRYILAELSIASNGLILRNDLLVIPKSLQQQVIDYAHEGHPGMVLVKRLLRSICWFPGMDKQIDNTIRSCIACQCNVDTTTTEPIIASTLPEDKMQVLALDFSSKTPTNDYLLVGVFEKARYPLYKLTKGMTTEDAKRVCVQIFKQYGTPKFIKTDNGPAFISHEWARFSREQKFVHQKITPLHPEANGMAERIMQPINKAIRAAMVDKSDWRVNLSRFIRNYRSTPHSSTGLSPSLLQHGIDNYPLLPKMFDKILTTEMQEQVRMNDYEAKRKMKLYADRYQHTKHRDFALNDPVLVKWLRTSKHQPLFDPHPYRITKINGSLLVATRLNHQITRNSKYFKIVSEECYDNAMKLVKTPAIKPKFSVGYNYDELIMDQFDSVIITPPPSVQPQLQPHVLVENVTAANVGTPVATTDRVRPRSRSSMDCDGVATRTRSRMASLMH